MRYPICQQCQQKIPYKRFRNELRTHFFYKKRTQLLCPGKYTRARVLFTSFTPVSFRPTFLPPAHLVRHPHTARPAHIAYTRTRETPHRPQSPHCPKIRPLANFCPPPLIKSLSRIEKTAQNGYFAPRLISLSAFPCSPLCPFGPLKLSLYEPME